MNAKEPQRIRVGVFAPLYPPAFRGGGPIKSIAALVRNAPQRFAPLVHTSDRDLGATERLPVSANEWVPENGAEIYYASASSGAAYWKSLLALRRRRPLLLHFNSFMNPRSTIVPVMLWRLGFWGRSKLLISPRGEFGDGALSRRGLKKRVYITAFRLLRLHRAVVWHSTAEHESRDISDLWGSNARIVLRPNDTLLPDSSLTPVVPPSGPLRAVFLGRIVEHKGLSIALEALRDVTGQITLDVYGSDEDLNYSQRCRRIASELPANIEVVFRGIVRPDAVRDVLAQHDLLLMPTAGENFGHVIAEALSTSCIVFTTPHTPWNDVLVDGGGLAIERVPDDWAVEIQQLATVGSDAVMTRRLESGAAYDRWSAREPTPHVWKSVI